MTTSVEQFDEKARRGFGKLGRTTVHEGELLRHTVYTRFLHWTVAIFFILALLSGMAIYSPWLFGWLTPLFGGGPMTRLLHPWFALLFTIFFVFQLLNWLAPMKWTGSDRKWLGRFKAYVTNAEKIEPEYVGFFNAGQKLYFWAIVGKQRGLPAHGIDNVVPGSVRANTGSNQLRVARHSGAGDACGVHHTHL